MKLPRPIRHGLLTVAVLGIFTAALSAAALYRVIAFSMAQRLERAREAVGEELALIQGGPGAGGELEGAPPAMIGMRGGVADTAAGVEARAPAGWRALLRAAAARAEREQRSIDIESPNAGAVLVGRVEPRAGASGPRLAWVAVAIKPSVYTQSWRWLVGALTLSALLLVASAARALIIFQRGAGRLRTALGALASDLTTPVPRPPVRELSDVADGIATLARRLVEARAIQERLGRDLAQQERLVALGRVVAGVAHEVRNPLASIKLRLDLAMAAEGKPGAPPLPASVTQAIAHASSEITRLDRLVADLLIVSGRALGPRHPTDVGALLRARAEALAPWSASRRVNLRVSGGGSGGSGGSGGGGGGGATVAADGDALARALDNLLRNAIEASPDGGTVTATVLDDGPAVRVRIQDGGAGVPAGRAGELFEPFFTTKPEGTGLGLAISRAIARAHGGDVVYAREGDVTRFELSLTRGAPPPSGGPGEAHA
ncbi:MAG TPA: ATP-binding protein [Polyangia bacterium]|jgi:signal transduction histidine kinase|nr:ATP-binding protein [Polyangia bacterium]